MAAALATAAAGLLARRLTRPRRGWALGWLLPMTAFVLLGAITATELWRVEQRWPAYAAELTARGHDALAARLAAAVEAMDGVAAAALDAAPAADAGFGRLADAVQGHAGMGVVRYDAGRATAWAGELRVDPAATGAPLGATFTPFYLAVTRQAVRGARRVAVTTVVSAVPPADRVASTLDERAARASGVQGYEFAPLEAPAAAGSRPVVVGRDTLFRARAVPPTPPSVRLAVAERARLGGTVLLALAYGAFLLVLWRRGAGAGQRLLTLAAGVALLGVAPLNELSNASVLFDPAVYFAPLAGPFTASVGALGGTAALAVLAVLAMMRTRARVPRWAGAVGAVAVAAVAPYLLRALAQGIALPPFGVTTRLWLAWEITLFLAATAVLLAGAALGRAALGAGRGLPPWVAPAMAGLTALLAPLL